MIKAEVIAHSIHAKHRHELITFVGTFPRIILAELNTHRMFSRNSASSRAIPFKKMVESVKTNPFIPLAFQKDHSGMQGVEYLSSTDTYELETFISALINTLSNMLDKSSKEYLTLKAEIQEKIELISTILRPYKELVKTLPEWWLFARDKVVEAACIMYVFRVSKQLANRLLEPFMWHTAIITTSKEGLDNFFNLRCGEYVIGSKNFKSIKEVINYAGPNDYSFASYTMKNGKHYEITKNFSFIDGLLSGMNKGQAEIHMMALAEAIYDTYHESVPEELQPGEWHIPYKEKIQEQFGSLGLLQLGKLGVPDMAYISSVMCARVSYTVPDHELSEWTYNKYLDKATGLVLARPLHASPFEHCGPAMTDKETMVFAKSIGSKDNKRIVEEGWCRNFRGFIQMRHIIEKEIQQIKDGIQAGRN